MKKAIALGCAAVLCALLTGCGFLPALTTATNTPPLTTAATTTAITTAPPPVSTVHTHWVGDGWIWDEDDHFFACAGEDCGEFFARSPHVMVEGACEICGYIPYLPEE